MKSAATNQSKEICTNIDEQIEYERKLLELAKIKKERERLENNTSASIDIQQKKLAKFWKSFDRISEENQRLEGELKLQKVRREKLKSIVVEQHERQTKSLLTLTSTLAGIADEYNIPKEKWEKFLVGLKDDFDQTKDLTVQALGKDVKPPCKWWLSDGCDKLSNPKHMESFYHQKLCANGKDCKYGQNSKNKTCRFVHRESRPANKYKKAV